MSSYNGWICNIFFHMVARAKLVEAEEQLVSFFVGGLRYQIQIALQQFNPLIVSEAHQRDLAMEIQYRSSWGTSTTRSWTSMPQAIDTSSAIPANSSKSSLSSTRPATSFSSAADTNNNMRAACTCALCCFSCGENSHRKMAMSVSES